MTVLQPEVGGSAGLGADVRPIPWVPAVALASGSGHPASGTGHPARAAAATGVISTLAGGVGGPGAARRVPLPDPCGLAVATGNVNVADDGSVRKVGSTGSLTTPAGTGGLGP